MEKFLKAIFAQNATEPDLGAGFHLSMGVVGGAADCALRMQN